MENMFQTTNQCMYVGMQVCMWGCRCVGKQVCSYVCMNCSRFLQLLNCTQVAAVLSENGRSRIVLFLMCSNMQNYVGYLKSGSLLVENHGFIVQRTDPALIPTFSALPEAMNSANSCDGCHGPFQISKDVEVPMNPKNKAVTCCNPIENHGNCCNYRLTVTYWSTVVIIKS